MLDVIFFKSGITTHEELDGDGECISFTNDGFKELINTGVFNLPHTDVSNTLRAISISKHHGELRQCFERYPDGFNDTRQKLLDCLDRNDWVTGDL